MDENPETKVPLWANILTWGIVAVALGGIAVYKLTTFILTRKGNAK